MQPFFTEPRPKREDIPENADPADVLFELRMLSWEWRYWRSEVNGDLGFLRRFRGAVADAVRATAVIIPVLGFVLAALVAFRII